ncbi:MAG: class I SAM-dependent methyltransferase [Thermoplasmatales archaeon]
MKQDQKKSWNREYRLKGKLWRGELKEKNILRNSLLRGTTLDNGCGNGKGTPQVDGVVGLDFSIFALALYNSGSKVLGDMANLPFKNGTFSNVLFIHSLDHLSKEERSIALKEAWRVLKEDGRVVVRVFSKRDFRYGKGEEIEEGTFLRGNKIQTHYFDKDEFSSASIFKVYDTIDINYDINIQNNRFKRREFIIILIKSNSENYQ